MALLSVTLHVSSLVLWLAPPRKLFSPSPLLPPHQHLSTELWLSPPVVSLFLLLLPIEGSGPYRGTPKSVHIPLLLKTLHGCHLSKSPVFSMAHMVLCHLPLLSLRPHVLFSSSPLYSIRHPGLLAILGMPQDALASGLLHLCIP